MTTSYDYVIIGSGIAGLYAALLAREHGVGAGADEGKDRRLQYALGAGGIAAPIGPGIRRNSTCGTRSRPGRVWSTRRRREC